MLFRGEKNRSFPKNVRNTNMRCEENLLFLNAAVGVTYFNLVTLYG